MVQRHADPDGRRVGYYGVGMLKLGWIYRMDYSAKQQLVHRWPFSTSLGATEVAVPFPSTEKEAQHLEVLLKGFRIDWGPKDSDMVRRALHNARLRLQLSHAVQL
jgi:hypothetical protein